MATDKFAWLLECISGMHDGLMWDEYNWHLAQWIRYGEVRGSVIEKYSQSQVSIKMIISFALLTLHRSPLKSVISNNKMKFYFQKVKFLIDKYLISRLAKDGSLNKRMTRIKVQFMSTEPARLY